MDVASVASSGISAAASSWFDQVAANSKQPSGNIMLNYQPANTGAELLKAENGNLAFGRILDLTA